MSNIKLSYQDKVEIRQLYRSDPKSWTRRALAEVYDVSDTTIYELLKPELPRRVKKPQSSRRRRAQIKQNQLVSEGVATKRAAELKGVSHRPISDEELRRFRRAQPADNRNFTQRFCGDPLPGRSALDQKQQST